MFAASQRIVAQHLYALLSSMTPAARDGAVLALSSLTIATEDGFLTTNGVEPRTDFFIQCFDGMVSAALALKMLRDDGMISEKFDITMRPEAQTDAELAIMRVENLLTRMMRTPLSEEVN